MTLFLAGVAVGLAAGLWLNRRAVTRRSEVISWMGEDIDRYAEKVDEVEALEHKLGVAMRLCRRYQRLHANGARIP